MRQLVVAIAVVTATAFVAPTIAQAKGKEKTVETKSQSMRGEAKDENIKTPRGPNDPNASKTKPATRQGIFCTVKVINMTPWYIDFFIDGIFEGTVGPWAQEYGLAVSGTTRFYGHADFTDGSSRNWGPQLYNCPGGEVFSWRLTP